MKRFLRKVMVAAVVGMALLSQSFVQAQDKQTYKPTQKDSLTFVNAEWASITYSKGIVLKQFHFKDDNQLFGSNQFISIVEINTRRAKGKFVLASDQGKITKTSKFAQDSGAFAAINGTFYNMKSPYNSVCYFKKNGKEEFEYSEKKGQRINGAVAISDRGKVSIIPADKENPGNMESYDWPEGIDAPSVMVSGPMLLFDGKSAHLDNGAFYTNRHPRSAIAICKKKVYLITVDGRSAQSQGVSLEEFTAILRYLGVKDALNLDGGGSTTLYYKGLPHEGIANHPSDNKQFDAGGERSVVNSLLFIKK